MTYWVRDVRQPEEASRLATAHETFFKESLYRDLTFDRWRTEECFRQMMDDFDTHVVVAYDDKNTIVGYNVFTFDRNCSIQEVAMGIWFYVMPEHRNRQVSQMLLDEEEKICQNRGIGLSFTSSTAGFSDNGRNERAYTRMRVRNGYRQLGTILVRRYSHG